MTRAKHTAITLEPGDCTRYDLDIVRLGPYDILVTMYKTRRRLSGRTMHFASDVEREVYTPHRVAVTMEVDIASAAVILAYLREHEYVHADIGKDYNQETGVWVGHQIH